MRVNAYEGDSLEAFEWYNKVQSPASRQMAWHILKRFFPEEQPTDRWQTDSAFQQRVADVAAEVFSRRHRHLDDRHQGDPGAVPLPGAG